MARDIDLDTVRTEVRRVVKRNARPVDDDEWNDLVQEVLYEIKRRELNFHSLTELGAWTNVVCRRIAARWRRQARTVEVPADRSDETNGDPLLDVLAAELVDSVRAEVLNLPDVERDVVIALYYDERSYAETARLLGIAEREVHNRVRRARRRLVVRLDQRGLRPGLLGVVLLPASLRAPLVRRIAGMPPVAAVAAVALLVPFLVPGRIPQLPERRGASAAPSVAGPGRDDAPEVRDGSPPPRAAALARTPDQAGRAPHTAARGGAALTVRRPAVRMPGACVGYDRRPSCTGDTIIVTVPKTVSRATRGMTDPLDGTAVTSDKVPLCVAPNTPATRCEPGPHRPT